MTTVRREPVLEGDSPVSDPIRNPARGTAHLFSPCWRPAETEGVGGVVELALRVVFRAAVVEAEVLVGEIEPRDDQLQIVANGVAALRVHLSVGVVIVVAERAGW